MRVENRKKQITVDALVFIAEDGTEFSDKYQCENHEEFLRAKGHKPKIPHRSGGDMEGYRADFWYIQDEEEFKWLCNAKWRSNDVRGQFQGKPEWYIVTYLPCDGPDMACVIPLEEYLKEYESELAQLREIATRPIEESDYQ